LCAITFTMTACGIKVPDKYKKNWSKNTVFDSSCYKTMQITGDKLKILQLTDIHFDDHNNRKEWTLDLIKSTIESANPDLIAVTGDWVSTNIEKQRDVATKTVFDLIDSYNIPWIAAFGNHDAEGELTKYDFADIFAKYKNSLFDVGFTNLKGGAGNYIVVVEKDGVPVSAVVIVDSHSAVKKWSTTYDWIGKDQIEWYKWAMTGVQQLYQNAGGAGTIPSINFQHIPLNEYKDNMDNAEYYIMGENNEDCFPGKKNTGWFDALKEIGSTKGVFFGHDHDNNKIIKLDGIYLGYGLQSGWCEGYAENSKKGGLLISLHINGKVDLEQIVYDK
ncbi:MAG: metallophosphoesterase, partial [Clostridia bacterium]|nr:metallophosphoesterase [Clostridia bacterium]